MPGLEPGIHVFLFRGQDVDGRDKPGHDELRLPCRNAAAQVNPKPQFGRSRLMVTAQFSFKNGHNLPRVKS
jgi:hypothetical protein